MIHDIEQLNEEIKTFKERDKKAVQSKSDIKGYNASVTILTDLLGCIFIGYVIGLFFQKVFETGPLMTAGMTFLGGIAGLYTTIRFALKQEKKDK